MSELDTILKHDGKNTAINLKMANERSEFAPYRERTIE